MHETNPFIRELDGHPVLLVTAGTAIDAATGWAAYRSYLAVYNVEMMRRAQEIRSASLSAAAIP